MGKNQGFMLISNLHSNTVIGCGEELNQSGKGTEGMREVDEQPKDVEGHRGGVKGWCRGAQRDEKGHGGAQRGTEGLQRGMEGIWMVTEGACRV